MEEVILLMQEIEGPKTSINLSKYFIECLQKRKIKLKVYCGTADKTLNNREMARYIANEINNFKKKIQTYFDVLLIF